MRLSRAKMNQLSRLVAEGLENHPDVELKTDPNTVRLAVFRLIEDEMERDEIIDRRVREKISSQKRDIPEGGREWEVLYRQYYEEERDRHRPVKE